MLSSPQRHATDGLAYGNRPLMSFISFEVQRQETEWSSRSARPFTVSTSAFADVGRWCLEGRLYFALPTFDHVLPKSLVRPV
jgi:hypothetical protein